MICPIRGVKGGLPAEVARSRSYIVTIRRAVTAISMKRTRSVAKPRSLPF